VRLRKGLASRYWEDLVLAAIGEQFDVGEELCGVVISIRFQEDIISVWNRSSTDQQMKQRIFEKLRSLFSKTPAIVMEYKNHDASMKDNSSFRNAEQSTQNFGHPLRPNRIGKRDFTRHHQQHEQGTSTNREKERDFRGTNAFRSSTESDELDSTLTDPMANTL